MIFHFYAKCFLRVFFNQYLLNFQESNNSIWAISNIYECFIYYIYIRNYAFIIFSIVPRCALFYLVHGATCSVNVRKPGWWCGVRDVTALRVGWRATVSWGTAVSCCTTVSCCATVSWGTTVSWRTTVSCCATVSNLGIRRTTGVPTLGVGGCLIS